MPRESTEATRARESQAHGPRAARGQRRDGDALECPEPCGGADAAFTCPDTEQIRPGAHVVVEAPSVRGDAKWDIRVVATDTIEYAPVFEVRILDEDNYRKWADGTEFRECKGWGDLGSAKRYAQLPAAVRGGVSVRDAPTPTR